MHHNKDSLFSFGDISGDYIAGFVDGEGCFALKFRRDIKTERKNSPTYFYWNAEFAICLRKDDEEILRMIKNIFKCGGISIDKRGYVRYSVSDITNLVTRVIPFFDLYKLKAKKRFDFELWKEAVKILEKNKKKNVNVAKGMPGFQKTDWNQNDLERLLEIHNRIALYKGSVSRSKWINFKSNT